MTIELTIQFIVNDTFITFYTACFYKMYVIVY